MEHSRVIYRWKRILNLISEKEKLNFNQLEESDKKEIKKLIKKMTIKDIIKKISDNKKISKKLIYSYCIGLKNEN